MIRLKSLLLEQSPETKKLNVLFIGDSQTVSSYSYARQLINNGLVTGDIDAKSGINMKSIYSKFRSKYEPGKYDLISILGGNNDASSKNFDKLSYEKIISAAKENNTPVIIITSPTMKFIDTQLYPGKYPSQDQIPAWQRSLESADVMVLDAYDLLDMKSNFVSDGLHLTKDSHTLLMKTWTLLVKKKFPNLINSDKVSSSISQQGTLKYGDVGEDVKQVQERLINLNYSVGPELNDGIFGPHTRDGVLAFQNVNNLTENGIIDTNMFELIKSSKAKTCPSNIRKQLDDKIIASSPTSPTVTSNFNDDAAEQAFPMIIKYEGYRPTSYTDSDGYQRIGYGSSTITQPDGTIIKLGRKKSAHVITRDDADRDLHRRIKTEFLPLVLNTIRKWGQDPNKFNAATLAVLTSVAYNYGKLKTTLRTAIQSGDAAQVAYAIQSLSANKTRRQQEGDYILASLDSDQETNDADSSPNETDIESSDTDSGMKTIAGVSGAVGAMGSTEDSPSEIVPVSYTGEFVIVSKYGLRKSGMHRGLDINAVVGTTIYIKKPGVVIFAGNRNPTGWGNMVEIKHDDGSITRYAHLSRIDVSTNDQVTAGMLIGLTGGKRGAAGAGNSTGPHLHWEWLPAGSTVGKDGLSVVDDYCSFSKPVDNQEPTEDSKNDNILSLKSIMNSIIN